MNAGTTVPTIAPTKTELDLGEVWTMVLSFIAVGGAKKQK